MADISKITLPDGSSYDIKDSKARNLHVDQIPPITVGTGDSAYLTVNHMAISTTAAGTAVKVFQISGADESFSPTISEGTIIYATLTNTNTAAVANIRFKIGTSGIQYPVKYRAANLSATNILSANRIYPFYFDGTNWNLVGDLDTNSNTTYADVTTAAHGLMTAADKIKINALTTADATTAAHGYMSAADKTKLNGIASGAEVNQNAFSNINIGGTTISADTKTDTVIIVGNNGVTITPDSSNDKITISGTTYAAATGTAGNPKMDGTVAVGTSTSYARADHVHPTDTTRVSTATKVNGKTLSGDITLGAGDINTTASKTVQQELDSLKDITAGGVQYKGITTTTLTDGATTTVVNIGGTNTTFTAADAGSIVLLAKDNTASGDVTEQLEFIWDGTKWNEFGSTGNLKALAFKASASGTVGVTTAAALASAPSWTGAAATISVKGTPAGSITTATGTANYKPGGTISKPNITVTNTTGSIHAVKTVGSLPSWGASVTDENLLISWSAGALPTSEAKNVTTAVSAALASTPTFTGTDVRLAFTGSQLTSSGAYTPGGTVGKPSVTITTGSKTVTVS